MEHVKAFLQYLKYEKRYSSHTITNYRRVLLHFNTFRLKIGEGYKIAVDFKLIRQWIVAMVSEDRSPSTINLKITVLRSYFKYVQKKGLATVNPMEKVGLLKMNCNVPVFVTAKKMDELLDDEPVGANNFEAFRDKMVVELFYMTGMRLSELIHLKDSDVDLTAMTVKVLGKRNKERIVPLTAPFCRTLSQYISIKKATFPDSDCLFVLDSGKPLYPRWVQRLTSEKLGMVTTLQKRSPHVLRHSFATNMLDNGAELNAIKEILGHTSLAATQVYTHSSLNRIKKVYNQAHPRA